MNGGYQAMHHLLQETLIRPDGLFAFSDVVAIGAMRALQDAGLRVPEDLSVMRVRRH